MSTSRHIREQRKAKQASIPADHVFDVTRALIRDQRINRTATAPQAPQSRARTANSKGN